MITEYELYSDERKDTPQGYLTLGGVVCTDRGRERLLVRLENVRKDRRWGAEVRWGKISASYLDGYKAWLDAFFDDAHARYSVLFVDRSSRDWHAFRTGMRRASNHDDPLVSVYYQFLLTTFGRLHDNQRWSAFPDAGYFSSDEVLQRVEFLFNRTYKKAFGPKSSRIIRLARALNSKRSDLVQLADVMLGCIACTQFAYIPDSVAKRMLLEHFKKRKEFTPCTQRGLARIVVRSWVPPEQFDYPAWG